MANDILDGGTGIDTATFFGTRADYSLRLVGSGDVEITDRRPGSPYGTDTLHDVETILFADRMIAPVAPLADVLWLHDDGLVATGEFECDPVSIAWQIHASGDFDGDGDGDIIWRHADGMVVTWEFEDGQHYGSQEVRQLRIGSLAIICPVCYHGRT